MTGNLMVLEVADDPGAWSAAGFDVADGRMMLDGVEFRLTGSGADTDQRGIRGWHLSGMSGVGAELDGLAFVDGPRDPMPKAPAVHENGVGAIDHLVIATPNLSRTIAAFEEAGLEARRSRTFRIGDSERQQTFFWAGATIIEMIGVVGEEGDQPANFWGLALVSDDLDATAAALVGRISDPKDAIQSGRRIATIKTAELGISVPIAVMTPHVK